MQKLIVFTDAHINTREKAEKVGEFLEKFSSKRILCLGDLFETPEDHIRFSKYLKDLGFIWLKGNHEYWLDLPLEYHYENYLFLHGHTFLVTRGMERLFIELTPVSRKLGVFQGVMNFRNYFENGTIHDFLSKLLVAITEFEKSDELKDKTIVMGHLHKFLFTEKILVLPPFPAYGVFTKNKIKIYEFGGKISGNKRRDVLKAIINRGGAKAELKLLEEL